MPCNATLHPDAAVRVITQVSCSLGSGMSKPGSSSLALWHHFNAASCLRQHRDGLTQHRVCESTDTSLSVGLCKGNIVPDDAVKGTSKEHKVHYFGRAA